MSARCPQPQGSRWRVFQPAPLSRHLELIYCVAGGLDLFEPGIVQYLGECRVSIGKHPRVLLQATRNETADLIWPYTLA